MYRPVTAIRVSVWGRDVGAIAPARERGVYAFEYEPSFLSSGIQLSPLAMPLKPGSFTFGDLPRRAFLGLPPVFADALPDSFGNSLVNGWISHEGILPGQITPLDRLAYTGRRAVGALCFEPERGPREAEPSALEMGRLVEAARRALRGSFDLREDSLQQLLRIGTSAGGAQAKAVIGWNRATDQFVSGQFDVPPGFEHWLLKFCPEEDPEAGRREYDIFRRARAAGIDMADCALVRAAGLEHFATRRFDRDGNRRHHVQTLSAIGPVPVGTGDYAQLFLYADALGLGYAAREEIFRRMAFNVAIHNGDDHAKNFSFLLREGGRWELAPAYDLTDTHFSDGPWSTWTDTHALSVNGKHSGITDADLLAVADRFGIGTARDVLARVKDAVRVTLPPSP